MSTITNSILQIMEKNKFKFYPPRLKNNICFDEKIFPEQELKIFLAQLKHLQGVIDIQRNVFDGEKIVTYIIFEYIQQKKIYESIKNILIPKNIIFNTAAYPLKNNIIINEKIILKNEKDFDIIVKEIESINIKPISIERNKLFMYENCSRKNFFKLFLLFVFKMKSVKRLL